MVPNMSVSLSFIVLYDKLNNPLCWTRVQGMDEEVHSFRPNIAKSWLQQRLRLGSYLKKYLINWPGICCNYFEKDVAIRYHSHKNVHEVCFKIWTHTFVPAFSETPCILVHSLQLLQCLPFALVSSIIVSSIMSLINWNELVLHNLAGLR